MKGMMFMSECTHDCSTCSENCSSREIEKTPFNKHSSVKKVIGVVSGKGGVGKSTVTAMLAVLMSRKGYRTAILDADITGPSIPKMFGIKPGAMQNEMGILPAVTEQGIKIMSINLLLEDEAAPVVWRGPVIGGAVSQFWTDVYWGDIDYMFIDMPPGTGDVPLTVYQTLRLDGIIIVTSPQDLVSLIVKKAYNMADMMNIPVLGLVENMSYFVCPDCKKSYDIFGESRLSELANELQILALGKMPIDPALASLADSGRFEDTDADYLDSAANLIMTLE